MQTLEFGDDNPDRGEGELPSTDRHASYIIDQEAELLVIRNAIDLAAITSLTKGPSRMIPRNIVEISGALNDALKTSVDQRGREVFVQKEGSEGCIVITSDHAILISSALAHWINERKNHMQHLWRPKKKREILAMIGVATDIIEQVSSDYTDYRPLGAD